MTDAQSQPQRSPLRLFEAFGVEMEYMIVDRRTLDVRPISDQLIHTYMGEYVNDVEPDGEDGVIAYSNELTLHVFEFKTQKPSVTLHGLAPHFAKHIKQVNQRLAAFDAMLLPTAMHPWMDPHTQTRLWPHDYSPVYDAFDKVFDCRGHGWANLQSTHLNLPFADDEEFGKLHAAIRLVLPLLPALAASSPVMDGTVTGTADNRLAVYRNNCKRVPLVTAHVIPEPAYTQAEYDQRIFLPMYQQIAPLDPDGILQEPWLNARGAIARFERGSIEIRLLDVQECPAADMAIVSLVAAVIRALCEQRWCDAAQQQAIEAEPLADVLGQTIQHAERAVIEMPPLLNALGMNGLASEARDVWSHLASAVLPADDEHRAAIDHILRQGTLATRMVQRLPGVAEPAREVLHGVYNELARCLDHNVMLL